MDIVAMRVYVSDRQVALVRKLSNNILTNAQKNILLVPLVLLLYFCGVCVSMTLGLLTSRFYTRSIYFDMYLEGHNKL